MLLFCLILIGFLTQSGANSKSGLAVDRFLELDVQARLPVSVEVNVIPWGDHGGLLDVDAGPGVNQAPSGSSAFVGPQRAGKLPFCVADCSEAGLIFSRHCGRR